MFLKLLDNKNKKTTKALVMVNIAAVILKPCGTRDSSGLIVVELLEPEVSQMYRKRFLESQWKEVIQNVNKVKL